MYTDIKPKILQQLRHGPLTLMEIVDQTAEAPFLVRAELKALKRDRLVNDEFADRAMLWRLTDRGTTRANLANQMGLLS